MRNIVTVEPTQIELSGEELNQVSGGFIPSPRQAPVTNAVHVLHSSYEPHTSFVVFGLYQSPRELQTGVVVHGHRHHE